MIKNKRVSKITYAILDTLIIVSSYMLTYMILKVLKSPLETPYLIQTILPIVFIKIIIFYVFGVYRFLSKYIGFKEILYIAILNIVINTFVVFLMATKLIPGFLPKTTFLMITSFEILLLVAYRIGIRLSFYIDRLNRLSKEHGKNTIIIGAGSAAELVLLEISRNRNLNNKVIGLLDDDDKKIGQTIYDAPVLGKIKDIDYYINKYNIQEVIISINNYKQEEEIKVFEKINKYPQIKIRKIKLLEDYDEGDKLKIVDVKVEDLLERDPVDLNTEDIGNFIQGEVVLVTGGGGSIGSELSRQIFSHKPKQLIIFDIYENNAYDIQMELMRVMRKNKSLKTELTVLIGSVYNRKRLEEVFSEYKPTLVFHAAAYKHVPLMEQSSREAIRTNVLGTKNLSELCNKYSVKKMVLVSSDKAVRPTNVMGATKRYAELIISHENNKGPTKFSAVRFGNVLGSNGSVIPLFKKQIEEGGPLTVTHKEVTRYFMTIPEAVGLILQSALFAKGGEIFVLDMGSPVNIYELAIKMIQLSGHVVDKDIKIEITGLRPGEKLYEELLTDNNDSLLETDHSRIFIEKDDSIDYNTLDYNYVLDNFEDLTNDKVKTMLANIIDTYTITEN